MLHKFLFPPIAPRIDKHQLTALRSWWKPALKFKFRHMFSIVGQNFLKEFPRIFVFRKNHFRKSLQNLSEGLKNLYEVIPK